MRAAATAKESIAPIDWIDVNEKLEPWKKKHSRPAWRPVVESGDRPLTASKFSGTPWLSADEAWPVCPGCDVPLQLFLQLNLSNLPSGLKNRFGAGLLQLFYCRDDDIDCPAAKEGYQPFSECELVRVVEPGPHAAQIHEPEEPKYFPAKLITGWEQLDDYPRWNEEYEAPLNFDWDYQAEMVCIESQEFGVKLEGAMDDLDVEFSKQVTPCHGGDKLAGWPHWIQHVEYPTCPKCNRQMELVFQIDSEDNLPCLLGDGGCGHITQCPKHKDVVAFAWACS